MSDQKITLRLSADEVSDLYELANGKAKSVSVPREMLMSLLIDHSNAITAAKAAGVKVMDPGE